MHDRKISVLDNGSVSLVDHWGSDEAIIEAARMSTNKGFQGWETDERLLSYLYRNNHATPFEMAGMVIEVKAPLFVFREWHRHRTQSYNEMSARYIPVPDEHYVPDVARLTAGNGVNKQANSATSNGKPLSEADASVWLGYLCDLYEEAQLVYQKGLEWGVPKELARLAMPVARYSRMRASANLRNWLGFLTLRMSSNAQWEIRQYAEAVASIVSDLFPRTFKLFTEGRQAHGRVV